MRRLSMLAAFGLLLTLVTGANPTVSSSSAAAQETTAQQRIAGAKNVILFVGDGMGLSTVTAARIMEGQLAGGHGEGNELSFELFPEVGLSQVYSVNFQVPDSAATITALMSAAKTNNGLVNVNRHGVRRNCSTLAGNELTSWFMAAEDLGLATGVVTTARLTHATPAGAYAVSIERLFEADVDVPGGCSQADIARQLIEFPHGDGIEVALGGGRRNFTPNSVTDPEVTTLKGRRADGRDLTAEWSARPDATYVWNKAQFDAVDLGTTNHLLGLFNRSHMEYEFDRADDIGGEPSLTEMTEMAITMLSRDADGFALVVEAARIDHAHHGTNANRALRDTIELSNAVASAVAMVDTSETLIVVTADHSQSLVISGYPSRGNDILGLADGVVGSDGLPYTTLNYSTGPEQYVKSNGSRVDLNGVDVTNPNFKQPALVPRTVAAHSGEDVPIYSIGPRSKLLGRVLGQARIGRVILTALQLFRGA